MRNSLEFIGNELSSILSRRRYVQSHQKAERSRIEGCGLAQIRYQRRTLRYALKKTQGYSGCSDLFPIMSITPCALIHRIFISL